MTAPSVARRARHARRLRRVLIELEAIVRANPGAAAVLAAVLRPRVLTPTVKRLARIDGWLGAYGRELRARELEWQASERDRAAAAALEEAADV